jgi:hypothetical protein
MPPGQDAKDFVIIESEEVLSVDAEPLRSVN